MVTLEIDVNEIGHGKIVVDGVDISEKCAGVELTARVGCCTTAKLDLTPMVCQAGTKADATAVLRDVPRRIMRQAIVAINEELTRRIGDG